MGLKDFLSEHKKIFAPLWRLYYFKRQMTLKRRYSKKIKDGHKTGMPVIYYCGIPAHGNLGDLAQGVCIRKWLKKHYPDYHVTELETNCLVNTKHSCLNLLKKTFNSDRDFVVFQSGYTTTDLGGFADIMHQAIIEALPDSRILMMPQTIFFKSKEREQLCSSSYNSHKNMLFLARDTVSYEKAKGMFPDLPIRCYPDIVTTLIGSHSPVSQRDGIIFCLRNDGEKFYSDLELNELIAKCKMLSKVDVTDTTKSKKVVKKAETFINAEIDTYSKYKVMITDRYHGTILSLVSGTPVVIIKTNDHKVVTGADWFKGIYDDYVFLANDLNEAFLLASRLLEKKDFKALAPYFEDNFYDKLPKLFEDLIK